MPLDTPTVSSGHSSCTLYCSDGPTKITERPPCMLTQAYCGLIYISIRHVHLPPPKPGKHSLVWSSSLRCSIYSFHSYFLVKRTESISLLHAVITRKYYQSQDHRRLPSLTFVAAGFRTILLITSWQKWLVSSSSFKQLSPFCHLT